MALLAKLSHYVIVSLHVYHLVRWFLFMNFGDFSFLAWHLDGMTMSHVYTSSVYSNTLVYFFMHFYRPRLTKFYDIFVSIQYMYILAILRYTSTCMYMYICANDMYMCTHSPLSPPTPVPRTSSVQPVRSTIFLQSSSSSSPPSALTSSLDKVLSHRSSLPSYSTKRAE